MDDLEFLKEIFKDQSIHLAIGTVVQLGLSNDGSILRVMINILPSNRQVVAEMTFADVYDVTFPEINDLALISFAEGDPDECHVIKLINNTEEPIPEFAQTGNSVKYSRPGKKLYLGSDTKASIGRPNIEANSPIVLGDILVNHLTNFFNTRMQTLLNSILSTIPAVICTAPGEVGIVNPAFTTALANLETQLGDDVSEYLSTASTNIVSQIAFTERGV